MQEWTLRYSPLHSLHRIRLKNRFIESHFRALDARFVLKNFAFQRVISASKYVQSFDNFWFELMFQMKIQCFITSLVIGIWEKIYRHIPVQTELGLDVCRISNPFMLWPHISAHSRPNRSMICLARSPQVFLPRPLTHTTSIFLHLRCLNPLTPTAIQKLLEIIDRVRLYPSCSFATALDSDINQTTGSGGRPKMWENRRMHAAVCLLRAGQPRSASDAAKLGQFIGQFSWVTGDPTGV